MIKFNTPEYYFADKIYRFLDDFKFVLWMITRNNYFINLEGVEDYFFFDKCKSVK